MEHMKETLARKQITPCTHSLNHAHMHQALSQDLANDSSLIALPGHRRYKKLITRRCNLALTAPQPIAIVFPKCVPQIQRIAKTAAQYGLAIQARSGGHSYGNHSLGSSADTIIIDLRHFQYVHVEKTKAPDGPVTARVGGGTRLKQMTRELYEHGRAIPHGTCPTVGIGGHATVGGLGPPSRLWGLTLDHILEMTIVLASGEVVVVSSTSHPDLFFALRGAAASFGVVVEFRFRTRPAPRDAIQFSCMITAPKYADMAQNFEQWQRLVTAPGLSRKLFSQAIITMRGMHITGAYFGSEDDFHNEPFAQQFVYSQQHAQDEPTDLIACGEHSSLQRSLHFLKDVGRRRPKSQGCVKMRIQVRTLDWPRLIEEWAGGRFLSRILGRASAFHHKSCNLPADQQITSISITELFAHLDSAKKGTPMWFLIFDLAGGAVNDVPEDATAFAHRNVGIYCQAYAVSMFMRVSLTSKNFVEELNGIVVAGLSKEDRDGVPDVYPAYVDPDLRNPQRSYWGRNLEQLELVKEKYDTRNVFRNAQSVWPACSQALKRN
jgi:hypothetical protein